MNTVTATLPFQFLDDMKTSNYFNVILKFSRILVTHSQNSVGSRESVIVIHVALGRSLRRVWLSVKGGCIINNRAEYQ